MPNGLTILPRREGESVSTEPRMGLRGARPSIMGVDVGERAEGRFAAIERGISPTETEQERGIRRQYLIGQARRHGVPPDVLAQQITTEGVQEREVAPTDKKAIVAAKTIDTAEGIKQWNPETQRYDILVGMKAEKVGVTTKEKLAELKLSAAEKKTTLAEEARLTKAKIISSKASKALGQTGFFTTGFIGSMLAAIPGTPAYDLDKTIDTIKANLGFEELASMRAASPTGGALGAIAVRELEFLQRAMDALEQGQTKEQFEEALIAVKTHYDNVIRNIEEGKKLGSPTIGVEAPTPSTAPSTAEGTTATNPTTGAKLIFRGGTWQPA